MEGDKSVLQGGCINKPATHKPILTRVGFRQ